MNLLSFCFYESFSIYLFSLCVTKLRLIKPQSDDEKGMKTCNYVRGPVLSPLIRLKTSPFSGRCASELRINMYVDIENIIHGFYCPCDEIFLLWFLLKNRLITNTAGNFIRLSMEMRLFLQTPGTTSDFNEISYSFSVL